MTPLAGAGAGTRAPPRAGRAARRRPTAAKPQRSSPARFTSSALTSGTQGSSLSEAQVEAIREAIRAEVFAAIDPIHDEGGRSSSGWFAAEWPHVVVRTRERLARVIGDVALAEISARLVREH